MDLHTTLMLYMVLGLLSLYKTNCWDLLPDNPFNDTDKVRLGPPENLTVIRSDIEIILQWNEPDIKDHELLKDPNDERESFSLLVHPNRRLPDLERSRLNRFSQRLRDLITQGGKGIDFLSKVFAGNVSMGYIRKLPDKPFVVTRDKAIIVRYNVYLKYMHPKSYTKFQDKRSRYQVLPTMTELRIGNLNASTQYQVWVDAEYINNVTLSSNVVTFQTSPFHGYNRTEACRCDHFGASPLHPECDISRPNPCICRTHYTGTFCDQCKINYYRVTPNLPCHPCPCNTQHSSGECRTDTKSLWCTKCNNGYTGLRCHMCDYGYFPSRGYCKLCDCNNHQNLTTYQVCTMDKGRCLNCIHNTTGDHCEKCIDGHEKNNMGDCLLKEPYKAGISKGMVAAIVVLTIIVLSVIAGFFVYHRYKSPVRRQFWTVEVRGNPEGVSFNDLVEDDQQGKQLEDLTFKKPSRKDYALLTEDV